MNIRYSFEGRHAVVTGGAGGIGLRIATDFLRAGARVTIWDWSVAALAAATEELASHGDAVRFARADVSSLPSCAEAAARLDAPIHVLVNNAGITRDKTFLKMTPEELDAVVDTNLKGVFHATKSVIERFDPASPHKRIINLASVVALYGNFGQSNYVASKAGVIGATRTLARELGRKGFTVNAIAPGFVLTPMVEAMPAGALEGMAERVPAGRLGRTEDIANACLFLASDEASYVNGAILSVDGGLVT